jgi:hypothetical protein
MYQAVEAVSKSGVIHVIEPIQFEENEQLVILRISKKWQTPALQQSSQDWRKFVGLLKNSPAFDEAPVAIQQAMRHEWD